MKRLRSVPALLVGTHVAVLAFIVSVFVFQASASEVEQTTQEQPPLQQQSQRELVYVQQQQRPAQQQTGVFQVLNEDLAVFLNEKQIEQECNIEIEPNGMAFKGSAVVDTDELPYTIGTYRVAPGALDCSNLDLFVEVPLDLPSNLLSMLFNHIDGDALRYRTIEGTTTTWVFFRLRTFAGFEYHNYFDVMHSHRELGGATAEFTSYLEVNFLVFPKGYKEKEHYTGDGSSYWDDNSSSWYSAY